MMTTKRCSIDSKQLIAIDALKHRTYLIDLVATANQSRSLSPFSIPMFSLRDSIRSKSRTLLIGHSSRNSSAVRRIYRIPRCLMSASSSLTVTRLVGILVKQLEKHVRESFHPRKRTYGKEHSLISFQKTNKIQAEDKQDDALDTGSTN